MILLVLPTPAMVDCFAFIVNKNNNRIIKKLLLILSNQRDMRGASVVAFRWKVERKICDIPLTKSTRNELYADLKRCVI